MKKLTLVLAVIMLLSFKQTERMQKVIDHAKWQSTQQVTYDGKYRQWSYPGGDVPANVGVCTDVIIRAYRSIDVDMQKLMHEDIVANPSAYNLSKVDANIDHRRVPNMKKFLKRQNAQLPVTNIETDYQPGDVVFWDVAAGHVGIVTDVKIPGTKRHKVVHNIGAGPELEDFLFRVSIVDHYRWNP